MTATDLVLDVYARVSRLGDDRQRSTEGQVDDCTARVAERGGRVGEVHVDSGRSAWNPRVRRTGWARLMDRLEKGATGGVVVFDLARFSRRPVEGERLIAAAEQGLLVLDSEDDYDLLTANGKKAFRDQLAGAAYESDRLSTRVKRGKRGKAMRGEPNGSHRPFGFEPDGVTVREAEATVLRDLADRLLAGESQDLMIRRLGWLGVRTSTGKPWTRAGLRQVLTRPRNAGLITYDGKAVGRLPGDPILTEEVHERVLAMYAARRRGRPVSTTYLLSGIAVCGSCGHALTGRPRPHKRPNPDGTLCREYWCQPRAEGGGCGRLAVDMWNADRHAAALVVAILGDPRHAAAVESAARSSAEERYRLELEVSKAEELAEKLAGRLGRGEIALRRHDAAVRPLDRRIADLRRRLGELAAAPAAPVDPAAVAASRDQWRARWDVAEAEERRALVRMALRGRRLVVRPLDRHAPRRFDPARIGIEVAQ